MRRVTSLMSPVEAAGYAMAPTVEDMRDDDDTGFVIDDLIEQPEVAFRNGHASAAHRTPRKLLAPPKLSALHDPSAVHWLRDLFSAWWIGRAHA